VYEEKYDGWRIVASRTAATCGSYHARVRPYLPLSPTSPALSTAPGPHRDPDGELCAFSTGTSSRISICSMEARGAGDAGVSWSSIALPAWPDLRKHPLGDRRQRLEHELNGAAGLSGPRLDDDGLKAWPAGADRSSRGFAKDPQSPYTAAGPTIVK